MPNFAIDLDGEGVSRIYPAGWAVTEGGEVRPAGAAGHPPPQLLADGSTVHIAAGQLVVTRPGGASGCTVALGDRHADTFGAGGHHVAVAADDTVLIVDADRCSPVGIVGMEVVPGGYTGNIRFGGPDPRAVDIDDTRLVATDGRTWVAAVDWRTAERRWLRDLPQPCHDLTVDEAGPSIVCDGQRLRLPGGEPIDAAPAVPAPSATLARGLDGWALWSPTTGARLTPPFAGAVTASARAATGGLAVLAERAPKDAPGIQRLSAWRAADGTRLWEVQARDLGQPRVLPGAVIVERAGVARLYDRDTGRLVWTVKVGAAGLHGVSIEADGGWCRAGDTTCPPWTGHASPLPAVQDTPALRHSAPVVPGRAAEARDQTLRQTIPTAVTDLSHVPLATRLAYATVDRPLPTTIVPQTWAVAVPGTIDELVAVSGGVAWAGSAGVGVIDSDGRTRWIRTEAPDALVGDGLHLFVSDAGGVHEIDPQTGVLGRDIPGAIRLRAASAGEVLVDVEGGEQAVVDATTLAVRIRVSGAGYEASLNNGAVGISWPVRGPALYRCARPTTGGTTTCEEADESVHLGRLRLRADDGVLTATTPRGNVAWAIHGVHRVWGEDRAHAVVQLVSDVGQLVEVDRRGRLTRWFPASRATAVPGHGIAGDRTLVRWGR